MKSEQFIWAENASALMKKKYGITFADAGLDDRDIMRGYARCTPKEYVDWFGEKYGLDPIDPVYPYNGGPR